MAAYDALMHGLRASVPQVSKPPKPPKPKVLPPAQPAADPEGVDIDIDADIDADTDTDTDTDTDIAPITAAPSTEIAATWAQHTPRPTTQGGSSVTVRGATGSSAGGAYGGTATAGTSGGDTGVELPPTRPKQPENLGEYENRMVAEYVDVGEKVVRDAHGKDAASDFLHSESAQAEFAQKAALQEYDKKSQSEAYASEYRTIGGAEVEVFVFDDGSEYYVNPKANPNDLQPGDVIRIEVPSDAR